MIVICPKCDEAMQVKHFLDGESIVCPRCGHGGRVISNMMPDWDGKPSPVLGVAWGEQPVTPEAL